MGILQCIFLQTYHSYKSEMFLSGMAEDKNVFCGLRITGNIKNNTFIFAVDVSGGVFAELIIICFAKRNPD